MTRSTRLGIQTGETLVLRLEKVNESTLEDWQYVHNTVIPVEQHSLQAVRERSQKHHLVNAYLENTLIGNATVRSPVNGTATLIVRVLPVYRRRGFGEQIYQAMLTVVKDFGCAVLETVVLGSSEDGLSFALAHGFEEMERYLYPEDGNGVEYIALRLEQFS